MAAKAARASRTRRVSGPWTAMSCDEIVRRTVEVKFHDGTRP